MKKKILSILLCVVMVLGLAGCGNTKQEVNKVNDIQESNEINDIGKVIDTIVSNGPQQSSSPFDYIKASQEDYNSLLKNPEDTFKYAIKDLINSNASKGLASYIEALLCAEINTNFKYDFESASDYLKHYKDFLTECDCIYNEYDEYAKSLLK